MTKESTRFTIGLGGWEQEALDECFYPRPHAASGEKLAYYAGFFDAVEVRPTFWDDTLDAADARGWIEAVAGAKQFHFTVKLHSSFTHARDVKVAASRRVRGMLQELARHNRLGTLLMQFPYSFTNTNANRFHLVRLAELFRGFPIHVELRHQSWNTPGLIAFLSENAVHPVSADLPHVRQLMPFITGFVGDHAYLRLHGRNEKGWLLNSRDTRYDYLYNSREIREIVRRLQALSGKCSSVTIICNNTVKGHAVANAFQLRSALRDAGSLRIPAPTLAAFPFLGEIAKGTEGNQLLFGRGEYREAM